MPSVQHVFLCAALIFVMAQCRNIVLRGGFCLKCGGIGNHRHDCPWRNDNE